MKPLKLVKYKRLVSQGVNFLALVNGQGQGQQATTPPPPLPAKKKKKKKSKREYHRISDERSEEDLSELE